MSIPMLIDTDMGVDDAVAITLALSADTVELAGIVTVEGNVTVKQASANIARLLTGLQWPHWPPIGEGLSQQSALDIDGTNIFGQDGLGEIDLPIPADFEPGHYVDVYRQAIEMHGDQLVILAIGPLTNLAALLKNEPELLGRVKRIVVMGGAIWCEGNVRTHAEFNFYRDPQAAAAVMSSGLPITVVPLDITRQVVLDEGHVAHLSRSGTRSGELLARTIRYPLKKDLDGGHGLFQIHDATALGTILWPALFLRAQMALAVTTQGADAGACKPQVRKDKSQQVSVAMSVNAADFLENMLEMICHEKFVV